MTIVYRSSTTMIKRKGTRLATKNMEPCQYNEGEMNREAQQTDQNTVVYHP